MRKPRSTSPEPQAPAPLPPATAERCDIPNQVPAPVAGAPPMASAPPMVGAVPASKRKAASRAGLTPMEREFVRALARIHVRALLSSQRLSGGDS